MIIIGWSRLPTLILLGEAFLLLLHLPSELPILFLINSLVCHESALGFSQFRFLPLTSRLVIVYSIRWGIAIVSGQSF